MINNFHHHALNTSYTWSQIVSFLIDDRLGASSLQPVYPCLCRSTESTPQSVVRTISEPFYDHGKGMAPHESFLHGLTQFNLGPRIPCPRWQGQISNAQYVSCNIRPIPLARALRVVCSDFGLQRSSPRRKRKPLRVALRSESLTRDDSSMLR